MDVISDLSEYYVLTTSGQVDHTGVYSATRVTIDSGTHSVSLTVYLPSSERRENLEVVGLQSVDSGRLHLDLLVVGQSGVTGETA